MMLPEPGEPEVVAPGLLLGDPIAAPEVEVLSVAEVVVVRLVEWAPGWAL